jgi:hypothetical protein
MNHQEEKERCDNYDRGCGCELCKHTDTAVDWLMAVRKYGIEKANEMFPEG